MRRTTIGALACALLLIAAPAASARPDHWPVEAPEPFTLELEDPAPYGELTDDFGPRWGRMHQGIDIGTLRKLTLVAAADGLVLKTGWIPGYEGYGQVVLIGHPEGYRTLYAHLSTIRVKERQRVEAGDWIGNAGCTGSCTGTHLHFEVHKRGKPLDPMPFLQRD